MKVSIEAHGLTVSCESKEDDTPLFKTEDAWPSIQEMIEACLFGIGYSKQTIDKLFGLGEE